VAVTTDNRLPMVGLLPGMALKLGNPPLSSEEHNVSFHYEVIPVFSTESLALRHVNRLLGDDDRATFLNASSLRYGCRIHRFDIHSDYVANRRAY
jgi:hypothetical protein